MKTLWNEIWSLVKKPWYSVPVLITTLLAYGYSLTHTIINMDDLANMYYFGDRLYIRVGRPVWWLLEYVTGVLPVHPFATGAVGLLLMLLAASCFCIAFQRASEDRLPKVAYSVFACLFVSYPMHFENWLCDRNCLMFGAAYLIVALAIICVEAFLAKRRWPLLAAGIVCMIVIMFLYESFLLVYICAVFSLLTLRWLFGDASNRKPLRFIGNGLLCAIAVLVAYAARTLLFPGSAGMHGTFDIEDRVKTILVRWILNGKWSFAVQISWGAILLTWLSGVVFSIRRRNASICLLLLGLMVSPFLFDILIGSILPARAYQAVPMFIAMAGVLVCACVCEITKKQWVRTGVYALLFVLCFRQAVDMDKWFVLKEREYNEELETARGVYTRLISEFDLAKPVQFVGLYMPSEYILQQCAVTKDDPTCRLIFDILDTDAEWYRYIGYGLPYHFQWCLDTFGDYDEWAYDHPGNVFEAFFDYHGLYGVHVGTRLTYEEANRIALDMPVWPAQGSVRDAGAYTIVKLGDIWIPPDSGEALYTGNAIPAD